MVRVMPMPVLAARAEVLRDAKAFYTSIGASPCRRGRASLQVEEL
jgi:hypothetical protein